MPGIGTVLVTNLVEDPFSCVGSRCVESPGLSWQMNTYVLTDCGSDPRHAVSEEHDGPRTQKESLACSSRRDSLVGLVGLRV